MVERSLIEIEPNCQLLWFGMREQPWQPSTMNQIHQCSFLGVEAQREFLMKP